MLSVKELISRIKSPVELQAGASGLNRMTTWAHAVDTDHPWLWVEPGDLMMTTGANLPSDQDGQLNWLHNLNSARVAGILLELPPTGITLEPGLLKSADNLGLPIITAPRPIQFNKIAHLVVESALRSRWERTEMIQRLFSSYTSHLRRGIGQQERLQKLCRILDAKVRIQHTSTEAVIFHHDSNTGDANTTPWNKIELPGREQEEVFLSPSSQDLIVDEEFMWHWATLVSMELGFEQLQLDQTRTQGEPLLQGLLDDRFDSAALTLVLEQRGLVGDIQLLALRTVDESADTRNYISGLHLIPGLRNEPHLITETKGTIFVALSYPVQERLLERLDKSHRVVIGLSRKISAANRFPEAADQAMNALNHARATGQATVRFDDFVSSQLGVFDRRTAQQRIQATLGPILAHDEEHSTELLHTLRTYLDLDRSGTRASEVLVIHRQTLIYRLKTIQRLTGINPNSTLGIVHFYEALSAFEHLDPRGDLHAPSVRDYSGYAQHST